MDLKGLKFQILNGSIARRVLLRAIMIASALSVIPLLQTLSGSEPELIQWVDPRECGGSFAFASLKLFNNRFLRPILSTFECKNNVNLTTDIVMELMGMKLIDSDAKTLCVGEGSASAVYALVQLGFVDTVAAFKYPLLTLKHKSVYELEYEENSFDFVLSGDLDKVSVPAILVLEIERVLKPGGIGVVLVGASNSNQISLIKLATPVSSLLKSSNVMHVDYIHNFTLVVFKKRINSVGLLGQYSLPADCQSVVNNKPFMGFLEPLVEKKPSSSDSKVSYLPNFINVAAKNKLAYVEIGAGQRLTSSNKNWFLPSYPIDRKAFNVYFVDHNTSVLLSCLKKPGLTFIYYPGLARENATVTGSQDADDLDPSVEDDGFDFLAWFKETVQFADLVVLKMKAGKGEFKFLADLFKTGAICLVDELFLSCSDHGSEGSYTNSECMDLFKSLRNSGMFVHQWWGD